MEETMEETMEAKTAETMEEEMEEERVKLPDLLPLTTGMTVEVMTMNNQITFVGRVERYSGESLILQSASGGELPPVVFNREVKLHFFRGNQSITATGIVCGSTPWLWKLERLERLFAQENRVFFRQTLDLDAKVQRIEPAQSETERKADAAPKPCKVMDASVNGLRLRLSEPYQAGDLLLVTELAFARGEPPFTFYCYVRRVQKEGGRFLHGCQIDDLSEREQDRLLRAIFVAQRKERQGQRRRG